MVHIWTNFLLRLRVALLCGTQALTADSGILRSTDLVQSALFQPPPQPHFLVRQ